MKRAMCLYIPFLSTDRLPGPADAPVAVVTPHGQSLRIAQVNRVAQRLGVRPQQTLAAAKAIVPELVTHDHDPVADRRQLESLAIRAGNYAALVHVEDEQTLVLDVTGVTRLCGSEANLLQRAVEDFASLGFFARGAVADTLGAAWAVAHAHPERTVVVPPGRTTTELAALPVWSLRLDAKIVESLVLVGVTTIASLLYLPRSSLTSRFGAALLDRLDQALGNLPEVCKPFRPASLLSSRFPLGAPTMHLDVLTEAIRRAAARFCDCLDKRVAGVRELFVTFECPDVETDDGPRTQRITRAINLSQPTRSSVHLFSLLKVMVEQLRLPAPADVLTLWARQLDKLDDWQDELFATDARDDRMLGDLLDRLVAHLGTEAVVRPQLLSEHQPERAFRYVSVTSAKKELDERRPAKSKGHKRNTRPSVTGGLPASVRPNVQKRGTDQFASGGQVAPVRQKDSQASRRLKPAAQRRRASHTRPLRLLVEPVEVAATALVPEGPPVAFRLQGTRHAVADSVGPERIETGWWRGPHVQRDYYRVITETGRRGWLFRERTHNRWFLHGWFD